MGNKALRQLTHEYTVGSITWCEYRERRQALIDEITGYPDPGDTQQEHFHSESLSSEPLQSKSYKVVILAVLVAAIIIAFMYMSTDPRKTRSQSGYYQTLSKGTKST